MADLVTATLAPHDHVVGFYERDDELVGAVASFLAPALDGEGTAVVIATPAHRAAIESALLGGGYAVNELTTSGRYIALDAGETLAAFMRDDRPDPNAFVAVIGALIDDAGPGPIHAFGEMVALLWDAGNVEAAIALETMWNDLAESRAFSLYCAYAMSSLESSGDLTAAKHVCDRHSHVVRLNEDGDAGSEPALPPADDFGRVFIPTPAVVRDVRSFVRDALRVWGEHRLLASAEVVVAELASNAVIHACSPFRVTVSRTAPEITVAVRDASTVWPKLVNGHVDRHGGRGMSIVAALSESWSTEPESDGKTVWATIARSR